MEIRTDRYKINFEELNEGGPSGFESVYLMSEGAPATEELYTILKNFEGQLLPAANKIIRQRNGLALNDAFAKDKTLGIASGFKPSGAYHFGHKLASGAVSFFQKNGVQVFIPVADIECTMDSRLTKKEYQFWAADNLLDWGANGVNLDAAHVYLQSEEHRVSTLAYMLARSLSFKLSTDIYGVKKMVDDFPFLFAGVTQVGDIMLPQHQEFGNDHSFMVSGQDQDGHMKMTVALVDATFKSGIDMLGVQSIPSGFYIPHIRGISGDKASSSKAEGTLYLGAGPNIEDLTDRIKSAYNKLDRADKGDLEKCSLDMVRFIDFFNTRSGVSFEELCCLPVYKELQHQLELAQTRKDQVRAQEEIDQFFIKSCNRSRQDNIEIIRDSLSEAITEHQLKRAAVLDYAKERASYIPSGWNDLDDDKPFQPEFWKVPDRAVVDESKRNTTQWFHIVDRASGQLVP
ncbi:MAG: hypothetical protein Q7R43_01945 [Candidatus Daviesbacteria bacterium]|nr:hypothetical protein [Candidatus Daviesbacteria bacterium]